MLAHCCNPESAQRMSANHLQPAPSAPYGNLRRHQQRRHPAKSPPALAPICPAAVPARYLSISSMNRGPHVSASHRACASHSWLLVAPVLMLPSRPPTTPRLLQCLTRTACTEGVQDKRRPLGGIGSAIAYVGSRMVSIIGTTAAPSSAQCRIATPLASGCGGCRAPARLSFTDQVMSAFPRDGGGGGGFKELASCASDAVNMSLRLGDRRSTTRVSLHLKSNDNSLCCRSPDQGT